MTLHNDIKLFYDSILASSQVLGISPQFVEKDYWITLVLSQLANSSYANKVVFKGGTSLSKGYGLINRFSEDVDVAIVHNNEWTGNQIKELIRDVEKSMTVGLTEIKMEGVTSKGSRFRKSVFEYPKSNMTLSTNRIITEVNSFANPFPFEKLDIDSFIAKFFHSINREDLITKYSLQPFALNILDKRQTLLEKLVSLIRFSFDEYPAKAVASKIRHFYDLYFLMADSECLAFVEGDGFKIHFTNLIEHDKEAFDIPPGWRKKQIGDSPLITHFSLIWSEVKGIYTRELSSLSFSEIPSQEDISRTIGKLFECVK